MKNGRQEIEVKSCVQLEQAIGYLQGIVASLKEGRVRVEHGERSLVICPSADVEVEVKARQKKGRESISLKIGWKTEPEAGEPAPELKITANAPAEKPPAAAPRA